MIKRTVKWLLLLLLLLATAGMVTGCWRSANYNKPPVAQSHHGQDRFISLAQDSDEPFLGYLRMRMKEGGIDSAKTADINSVATEVNKQLISTPSDFPQVTWLGHATVLVQYQGITFMTDPHLTQHATPLVPFGPKRVVPPALTVEQLPDVDFVVISHNHYDHLDHKTVRAMGNQTHWYVPWGLKDWMLKRGITTDRVTEMDWWQEASLMPGVQVVALPSQHWSKRTPFDTNKTLWASWHININGFKTWFAGDTGYHQQRFQQIGQQLGPHDLALIPIGAYGPRYFMLPQHVDPFQAINTHQDVRSNYSVGIHWGTFELTHEPFLEPQALLHQLTAEQGLKEAFQTMKIGETRILDFVE